MVLRAPACLDWPLRRVPNPPFPPRIGRNVEADRKKHDVDVEDMDVEDIDLNECFSLSMWWGRLVARDSWVMISWLVIMLEDEGNLRRWVLALSSFTNICVWVVGW